MTLRSITRGCTNLTSQESKSWRHRCLKDTEEEANGNCPAKVLGCRKASKNQAPDYDAGRVVFSQRKVLKTSIGRVFESEIASSFRQLYEGASIESAYQSKTDYRAIGSHRL